VHCTWVKPDCMRVSHAWYYEAVATERCTSRPSTGVFRSSDRGKAADERLMLNSNLCRSAELGAQPRSLSSAGSTNLRSCSLHRHCFHCRQQRA